MNRTKDSRHAPRKIRHARQYHRQCRRTLTETPGHDW
jgi:hypothetical protein